MSFSATFVLLQQEAFLASGSLAAGLSALRNATFPDKAAFYSGFFNTSIAFERVMKLVVIADHMLQHSFAVPSKADLKNYGHDLVALYASSVAAAARVRVKNVVTPKPGSIEEQILAFLSEFAKFSRYYNLDALGAVPTAYGDPLARWDEIIEDVLSHDVPKAKIKAQQTEAEAMHDLMASNTLAIQHGMDGKRLPLRQVFSLPGKHILAAPYVMVRVFRLLTPLLETVSELGERAFYGSPRNTGPHVPLFGEFFVHFGGSDAEIRRKKRWP
jgi:hypothetical protein